MNLLEIIKKNEVVESWQQQLFSARKQLITGLSGSGKNLVMAASLDEWRRKVVIITPSVFQATQITEDLTSIWGEEKVYAYPVNEVLAAELAISSPEATSERIAALDFLADKEANGFFVAPIAAMRKFLPNPTLWQASHLSWAVGSEVDFEQLPEQLVRMGYRREEKVATFGEFSIRGSIVDIFPLTFDNPVRIELFDVEIDSIRSFDADTQRSLGNVESLVIPPATEYVFSQENLLRGAEMLEEALSKKVGKDDKELTHYFDKLLTSWRGGQASEFSAQYTDFLYQEKFTLFDYIGLDDLIFIDDYARILEMNRQILLDEGTWQTMKLEEGKVVSSQVFGADFPVLLKNAKQSQTYFSLFQKGMGNLRFSAVHNFTQHTMQQFFGQMPLLKSEIERWQQQQQTVVVLVENEERQKKTEELFQDWNISVSICQPDEIKEGGTQIVITSLQAGFEFQSARVVVLTEREIFNKNKKRKARRHNISNAERLKSYNELKVGDYVVHANHGVGQYIGMETIEIGGVHQDYISILYQNDDKLFIPVTQLNLIAKYTGSDGKTPTLNKMSDTRWAKTKAKVSKQVEDIADDLIALYAERESRKGFAFSPDTEYQMEFENSFVYTETEDQLRSTEEIKRDMEREQPMDRLLVGDVGFGKTEVALRAAFKAIQDGKQVALLVPTTILAQQHYETMTERFEGFPVNIGLLSRFRTKKEQNETLKQLRTNQIDIIVGTHRLLSKDIEFSDLGLLIIDEEQRFGVKHKERLKQLKTQVDVLTLTATPIPRTLHMSMMGVRDLSVIETPPANRFPVQTYVMEQNLGAVRDAVLREMARGGQVFYLYNRVESIEQKVSELESIIPEATIGYAHGQMSEVQLENVLYDFIEGAYDVLVTTTIIETGVDIPNVNTMFVENADFMGLSTLYQLRGRVGRSNRVAYTYFMYKAEKVLNEVSEKRLQAMRDFTELGSGFKIAMRDMSIRGAGNLLGAQQHGFIDAVGFEMYSQMLEEAVKKRQGTQESVEKTTVEIDLGVDAYLPKDYVADERQKIELYKRIRELEDIDEWRELQEDLIDRFGDYPREVDNLLFIGRMKMDGELALVEKMQKKKLRLGAEVLVTMSKKAKEIYTGEQFFEALSKTKLRATLGEVKEKITFTLEIPRDMEEDVWVKEVMQFVEGLREVKRKA
ncbi:transcription-repair coupling factor (superfamily II helicase) [Pilibacter termitis]|uniref:Transcription-repair-coupling factor n=1 Tax=Pilibacter termitis TaxID=263852 RepID=A0A1T4QLK7_9ENTE|nr:transcription-repair coupling factor [Pilibacter termitis]SKA04670.1 transcription-repair coupling factor (superfamily II helicase) [Pilibacter termitis]